MATELAHLTHSTEVEGLLGRHVRYQKHKPGKHLLVGSIPEGVFSILSIRRFGTRTIVNDGAIVLEGAPTVVERKERIALFLPTGEELYLIVQ